MIERLSILFRIGARIWAVALVVMSLSATGMYRPHLEPETIERALAGADWLAERASQNALAPSGELRIDEFVEWLLSRGLARGEGDAAFREHLIHLGYEAEFPVFEFLEVLPLILLAYDAATIVEQLDPDAIRDELASAPTVPLDARDAAKLRLLLHQRDLLAVSQDDLEAAEPYLDRIRRLLAHPAMGVAE